MTQWKPTYGLRNAVPTVVALENALIGMGHEVGPVLRYRMTEIVREALDRAVGAPDEPELPIRDTVSEGDVPDFWYPITHGVEVGDTVVMDQVPLRVFGNTPLSQVPVSPSMRSIPAGARLGGISNGKTDHVAETKALAENLKAQKPQKRGRGRPKGAKGRKAKAGKTTAPEAAGEAPAT